MKSNKYIMWFVCSYFNFSAFGENVDWIGNPDDTAKIERPCPTYDLNCIRVFFQQHGHCQKTFGPVPDPISRPQSEFYVPKANYTETIVDQRIGGLNGRIEEFFINRDTDNLVIAVEFRNMTQFSDKLFFKTHHRGKEPVVTTASYFVSYEPLIITAVIPKIDDLQLQDAECTTYSPGRTASSYAITPSAIESTDPQPALSLAFDFTNVSEGLLEVFFTDSAYFIATYIQYNICDFGLFLT